MLRTDWDGSIITGKGYRKRVGYRFLGDPKEGTCLGTVLEPLMVLIRYFRLIECGLV